MRKERNNGREITIREDMKIRGTNIILESGDVIQLVEKKYSIAEFESILTEIIDNARYAPMEALEYYFKDDIIRILREEIYDDSPTAGQIIQVFLNKGLPLTFD